jgi:flagellar protein FliS
MAHHHALDAYQNTHMITASPTEILLALMDGLLLACDKASQAMVEKKPSEKGVHIGQALAIIGELRAALDASHAPELVEHLDRLYDYMDCRLQYASATMSPEPVEEVKKYVQTLQEAWRSSAQQVGVL